MKRKELKTYIILLSCIIVCLGLFLSYSVNHKLYKESHIDAMIGGYKLAARQGVLQIEYSMKYGKSIEHFYNMDSILRQVSDSIPEIDNIKIVSENGEVLYSLYKKDNGISIDELIKDAMDEGTNYIKEKDYYYVSIPIKDAQGSMQALMSISIKDHVLNNEVTVYEKEYGVQFLLFALGSIIIIVFVTTRISLGSGTKKRYFVIAVALVVLTVLILGIFNGYLLYMTKYSLTYSVEKVGEWLCSIVQMDINRVLSKGVTINRIYDISGWLEEISSSVPEIKNLYITDQNDVQAIMSQLYIQKRTNIIIVSAVFIIIACILLQLSVAKLFMFIDDKYIKVVIEENEGGKSI